MISYLEFPNGEPMPKDPRILQRAIGELIVDHSMDLRLLDVGVYDITPKIWTKNTHNHELIVLEDGNGIYRLLPKDQDVGTALITADNPRFRRGGSTNNINAENPLAVVGGGHKEKSGLQIFGIIAHIL